MSTDGEYTAVIDRFEGDLAVLLLERDGETVGDVAIPRTELSPDARHQDAVLCVTVEDGEVQQATYEPEETTERKEHAQSRFDQLSQRPPESEADAEPDRKR